MAYGSDSAMTAYLALTGRVVHPSHSTAVAREYGSLYVDQFEQDYRGCAVTTDASFPRDLWETVPTRVEHAAYEAGYAWSNGAPVFGDGGTMAGTVTSEKVDTLAVTYAEPMQGVGYFDNNRYILPPAYTLLLPFLKRKGGFYPAALVV